MTLPASGQISINDIRLEEGLSGGDYSLAEMSTQPKLNTLASPRPDASVPHAMSEFYSYNHQTSLTPTVTPSISGAAVSPSLTPTVTPSLSVSLTPTVTPSTSIGASASVTPSTTPPAPSASTSLIPPSESITPTVTPSLTQTPTVTPSETLSASVTPTVTPTMPDTMSVTPTVTPSESAPAATPSVTPTPSVWCTDLGSITGPAVDEPTVCGYNYAANYELWFDGTQYSTGTNCTGSISAGYYLKDWAGPGKQWIQVDSGGNYVSSGTCA